MISILLATYQGARYIRRQLDSLLNQTHEDFTVVISDDCSDDGTVEILNEYAAGYPDKIRLMLHDTPSGGAQNNFFRMLAAVRDDYVMLCDQDDVWLPEKIQVTLERMREMEAQFGKDMPVLVHGDLKVVDEELRVISESMASYQKLAVRKENLNRLLAENSITGNTVMVNRALQEYLDYIPEVSFMHDWWLGLLACCFGRIAYIDRPLTLYCQHRDNELGAEPASGVGKYFRRLGRGDEVRENYRRMFGQAGCLYDHYRDDLPSDRREVLERYLQIRQKGRIGKIRAVIRGHYFKSTWFRTLCELFTI